RDVTGDALDALDQPACAHAHLLHGLALGNRRRPDRPVRLLLANGLGRDALVDPVVPLVQVLGHLGAVAQARQAARRLRAPHGAREDEHELVAGQIAAEGLGLLLPARRQRDVGPAGVLAALAPLGLRHAPGLRVARVAAIPYAEDRPSSPKGYPEEPISPPMTSPPRASILIVDDSRRRSSRSTTDIRRRCHASRGNRRRSGYLS